MGNKRLGLQPYIEAQARHETGNYSSNLAKTANNLFGMKRPVSRPFFGVGQTPNGYAVYRDYSQSVQDLLQWMDSTGFPGSVKDSAEYVAELKKRKYFEDSISTYLKGVNVALLGLKEQGYSGFQIKTL